MQYMAKKIINFWFPLSQSEWTRAHKRLAVSIYVGLVIFGLSIPENIFALYPWLQKTTEFMALIIPQIDNASIGNPRGDAVRVLFSSIWVLSPFLLPLIIKEQLNLIRVADKKRNDVDWSLHVLRIIFVSIFSVYGLFLFDYKPTLRINGFLLASPIGASLFAPLVVYIIVWPACYLISLFKVLKHGGGSAFGGTE